MMSGDDADDDVAFNAAFSLSIHPSPASNQLERSGGSRLPPGVSAPRDAPLIPTLH
jgi:hypothetical protein